MGDDNEIIDRTEGKAKPNKKEKREKAGKKKSANTNGSHLFARFTHKKWVNTVAVLLILLAVYGFLACISYLFTWQDDQDQVLHKSFWSYVFSGDDQPVYNWLGKFGAWISHLLLYRWFGMTSIALCLIVFLIGVRMLLKVHLLPLKKTMGIALLFMVWGSIFLGFFDHFPSHAGGTFGYFINQWLIRTIGSFGTMVFILAALYITILVLFNPDFDRIWAKIMALKGNIESNGGEEEVPTAPENQLADIVATNTIKDDQIQSDEKSEAISFDEEELMSEPADEDDDFEIAVAPRDPAPSQSKDEEDELEVAVGAADEALSEEELSDLQKEFGDYDPTLDLSSYVLPPIDLLKDFGGGSISINKQELEDNKNRIVETLSHYKIDIAKIKATVGPTVTLYEIVPAPGVRISKIKNLEDDIALSLSALGIRIIAPIPGKGTIGIEVPNSTPEMVSMRSLIASEKFQNSDMELPVVMGKTITNETYLFDLTKMPHLLVAGATGQGKSVGLNALLISILYKKHPAQVKFVLVDPKKVELTLYNKIERHFLAKLPGEEEAIITDTSKVVNTLNSLCIEMDDRYEMLKTAGARTIKEYNAKFIARRLNPEKGHRYLPYIVVLIDEFADLIMTAGKEVEHPIARIAQLARAVGIHLIVATQRPSVNVITGMIKANFPARIAFRVLSKIDSRTILDSSGADQLIGRGDMLISTGSDMVRLQCGFVDTPEVEAVCEFIGDQRAYPEALLLPEYVGEGAEDKDVDMDDIDPLFADAARLVVIHQQGSASLLQRKLKLGYNRAGRIVDQLEGMGIIGPFQGSKARDVLFADDASLDEYLTQKGLNN